MSHTTTAEEIAEMESGPVSDLVRLNILARRLPKAELHSHISGAVRPSFSPLPRTPRVDEAFDYSGMEGFFSLLPRIGSSFTSAGVFTEAVLRILENAVDLGCRHTELTLQPMEFVGGPLSEDEVLDSIGAAFLLMRQRCGLSGGLVISTSRAHDAAQGVRTVESALRARDRGVPVLGIGNDGPFDYPLSEYAKAYDLARSEGLRTTCHLDIPEDISEGLDLGLDRIDHGYDLDGENLERVREAGIPLTMCVFGNMVAAPGKFPTAQSHPFEKFREAGLKVSLHTDDGALYFTDIAQEYQHAAQEFGWNPQTMADVAMTSLEVAWIDESVRPALLEQWKKEAAAFVADARNPGGVQDAQS